jgi:hypothetical protein
VGRDIVKEGHLYPTKEEALKHAEDEQGAPR